MLISFDMTFMKCDQKTHRNDLIVFVTDGHHNNRAVLRSFICSEYHLEVKVKSMQRPGTEAIRTQIKPSKPKPEITKITNSRNTNRTYAAIS